MPTVTQLAHHSLKLVLGLVVVGVACVNFSGTVRAVACAPPQAGNFTMSQSCTFANSSEGNSVDGVYNGDLIIPEEVTLTINAGQTVCWYPGNSILLNGGDIAINATGQLRECNVVQTMMASLGLDVYGADQPARIYDNNLFVCSGYPCEATAPSAAGNLIVEGVIKMVGGSPGAGKVLTSDADGVASWQDAAGGGGWTDDGATVRLTTASDNVGIGTTAPGAKLGVQGNTFIRGDSTNGTFTSAGQLAIKRVTDNAPFISFHSDDGSRNGFLQIGNTVLRLRSELAVPLHIGTNNTDDLTILSNGNVGIGTSNPTYKLQAAGDIFANGGWLRTNGNTGWHNDTHSGGVFMTETTWVRTYNNNKSFWTGTGYLGSGGGLTVGYGGATPPAAGAIIAGGVGIGTSTNGGYNLNVAGTTRLTRGGQNMATSNGGALEIFNNSDGGAAYITFHRGAVYGAHFGLDTDNWFTTRGWSPGANGYANMRVGRFSAVGEGHLFGLSSYDFAGFPFGMVVNKIDYTVALFHRQNAGAVAQFNSNGGANSCSISPSGFGSVSCTSDITLKKNIEPLDSHLDRVMQLNPVYYNWKTEEDGDPRHAGFIAQEVEKIYPNQVTVDELSDKKILALDGFVPMIVKAIQEQQAIIKDIATRLAALERRLGTLDTEVQATAPRPVGNATVPASATRVFVSDSRITNGSKVFITPRVTTTRVVSVIEVKPGLGFTLVTSQPGQEIPVDYVIVQ